MREEFRTYLLSIGLEGPFFERCEEIVALYERLLPEQVREASIFVSDYVDEENRRRYEGLWLISSTMMMEAKDFLNSDDVDVAPLASGIRYWRITKKDFVSGTPTVDSRMTLHLSMHSDMTCDLKASGTNCQRLFDLAGSLLATISET